MNKIQVIALSLFVLFFSIALTLDSWNSEDAHLNKYSDDIENHLHPLEYKVEQMFANKHNFWVSIF